MKTLTLFAVHSGMVIRLSRFLLLVLVLSGTAFATDVDSAAGARSPGMSHKHIAFEVTEIPDKFIFDETPLVKDKDGNDVPGDGNEFKTEGFIYLPGTLQGDGDGINPDGSPQYPDRVIGRWYCWGFHVGNGAATETGPWVITNQLYDFGDKDASGDTDGSKSLISAGLELVDLNETIRRAITGGTGAFQKARGEVTQALIGFNQLGGVNLRFEVRIR